MYNIGNSDDYLSELEDRKMEEIVEEITINRLMRKRKKGNAKSKKQETINWN